MRSCKTIYRSLPVVHNNNNTNTRLGYSLNLINIIIILSKWRRFVADAPPELSPELFDINLPWSNESDSSSKSTSERKSLLTIIKEKSMSKVGNTRQCWLNFEYRLFCWSNCIAFINTPSYLPLTRSSAYFLGVNIYPACSTIVISSSIFSNCYFTVINYW